MLAMLDTLHGLSNGMFSCDEHFASRICQPGDHLTVFICDFYGKQAKGKPQC